MRKNLVVGIIRETKKGESRTPLVPADVNWLIKRGISVEVENSPNRVFNSLQYKKSGAKIVNKCKQASLLVGVKEPRIEDLCVDKIYMVFSHTIKGQFKNMPLLKGCLKKRITLIDYEKIADMYGRRLVYFGRFAGICGMIDSLYYLGKKLEWKNIKNPFSLIKPSHKYDSLKAAKKAMVKVYRNIQAEGFSEKLSPFVVGITGHGNVSKGAQEILNLLNPTEIHPKDILRFTQHQRKRSHKLYKIVFFREEKLRSKDGKGFYFEEYLKNPGKFESNMDKYIPYLNLLIHTSYWDRRFPRMVTKKMIQALARKDFFRLEFIGDISCDVNGSIELTRKTTTPDKPTFTYVPESKKFIDGYKSKGITLLAVDNLPSELPKDASVEFSTLIREYVYQIAAHGVKDITQHMAFPAEIRRAVITENEKITKNFSYLKKHL
jgi:alpha-aminoadipic semialdehyde synthase